MSADEPQQDGPRFQRPPTGPWVAPPRAPASPSRQRPANAAYKWRRLASMIFFTVMVASVGVRAYRDLSRPEAWDYWKDQYVSPSLSSTTIANLSIDQAGHERSALAVNGRIGPAAANWLRDQLDDAHLAAGDLVLLSSPGGDLGQAIIIGEIIRARGLSTAVGTADAAGRVRPAYCASACVLAFAGGATRYGVEGSALGVHRFVTTTPVRDPVADTQRVAGAVLGYMTRMGVSSRVVEAMSATRDIRWLDAKEALAMNLVTAPIGSR